MEKLRNLWSMAVMAVIVSFILVSGCTSTVEGAGTTNGSPTPGAPITEQYPNAALGGTFGTNDKVEYLDAKGIIVTGKIENGIVSVEPLQINNESLPVTDKRAALLVYSSFEHPTYGHMALVHYPQRSAGAGEYDLYDDGELVATMKFVEGYGRNAYVTAACEPDSSPEYAEQLKAIVIKKIKECS